MNLVHAIDDPTAPRTRRQGCLRDVGITVLVMLAMMDLLIAASGGGFGWAELSAPASGLAAVLWPAGRRPAWLTPQLRTAVPAGISAALTAVVLLTGRPTGFGPGEAAVLLCLLLVAVRACPPAWVGVCAALNGAAAIALPLRLYEGTAREDSLDTLDTVVVAMAVLVLLVAVIAGLGGYLRTLDHRRRVAVTETRRAERLAMAADLHDFVAHHVTGILVQTQMARMMATSAPERLDPVLAGIEGAATQALASMRRTVGILRDHDDQADIVGQRPPGDLAALTDLVDGFDGVGNADGHRAVLHRDPSVPDSLPHEVQAAAHRVVQEALTNVRRHAADATAVTVALAYDNGTLHVTVRDNGRGGARLPEAARGGGFGLVGLTERVTALGGELHTAPRPDGGWEVLALLPAAHVGTR